VEFERPALIAQLDRTFVREVHGGGPFELERGQVTDDTELALCLARSLVARGRYDEEDVARRYVEWCASHPPDCGGTTRRAFGTTPSAERWAPVLRHRALQDTQANGALMRVSPLGLFGASLDPHALHDVAAADATLSHPNPVCVAANQVFVFAIASAVRSGAPGPQVFEQAMAFASATASCSEIVPTLELARHELPRDAFTHMGWVRHAFQCAFHQLLHARDFEAALVQVISLGGDTDTNGCITGALLGSVLGADAIPERWRAPVRECRPLRPEAYWCHDLDALAVQLLQR
jgi:ADP-ribosylglycohydrolase